MDLANKEIIANNLEITEKLGTKDILPKDIRRLAGVRSTRL